MLMWVWLLQALYGFLFGCISQCCDFNSQNSFAQMNLVTFLPIDLLQGGITVSTLIKVFYTPFGCSHPASLGLYFLQREAFNSSVKNELSYCGIVTQLRGMAKV